ncbi:hemolysin family protein [uncultured Fusobacterium sp.]|uniref:hemolysin family protein n=1 Tax=uncultured Fusobacterium sp. TaxID=159267 RepID=UPI0025CEA8FD|nr:hemolysin family protein [uncultured Fusobacterium sp.]
MNIFFRIVFIFILVLMSVFLSMSEISLASARKMKLQVMIEEGNENAAKVLEIQQMSGNFFTVVQIGINAIAIMGGILGDNIATPWVKNFVITWLPFLSAKAEMIGSFVSFFIITGLFIEFADLIPKRLSMVSPEKIAVNIIKPMLFLICIFKPLILIFNGIASFIFKIFKVPQTRNDIITYDDIFAVVDAGAEAGVVQKKEHSLIENIFELDTRWVSSIMTTRDEIIYLTIEEGEESIKDKIANYPHSKFLVCQNEIDSLIGYVDSKDILPRILKGEISGLHDIQEITNTSLLIIPNTLTLSEALDRFNEARDDFAIILNEYGHVVGLVTLNDVVNTLMGDIVYQDQDEQQIICRGEGSWLIDGVTPIEDVKKVLEIEKFPEEDTYETIAGFMMYMLKSIPKKAAKVEFENYTFEVVDVDNFKVDQLLVNRVNIPEPPKEI